MGMPSRGKSKKEQVVICSVCGKPKTRIFVIINHKTKACTECGCGILDKKGNKIE